MTLFGCGIQHDGRQPWAVQKIDIRYAVASRWWRILTGRWTGNLVALSLFLRSSPERLLLRGDGVDYMVVTVTTAGLRPPLARER